MYNWRIAGPVNLDLWRNIRRGSPQTPPELGGALNEFVHVAIGVGQFLLYVLTGLLNLVEFGRHSQRLDLADTTKGGRKGLAQYEDGGDDRDGPRK
ncbi:hypothetical protein [Nonomuraea sp. NPDC050202]|uniref:hypothetical protein n=1 Tax=Nonomuraea sp. NPDC050202 TaxID=3155035 RepID=UPI00340B3DF1